MAERIQLDSTNLEKLERLMKKQKQEIQSRKKRLLHDFDKKLSYAQQRPSRKTYL